MDKSILTRLIDNTTLALVVIGLFLFVLGAAGGWPNPPLQVNEFGWRVALALIGAFVAGVGAISYWKERMRPAGVPSADQVGIQIVSPGVGEHVGHSFPVSGIYRTLPDGYAIWTFAVSDGKNREYWPQARATIDRWNKTWHGRVNWIGGKAGDTKLILVFAVGKEGQVLTEYYDKVGHETDKWPSIFRFTTDMIECAEVNVIMT